MHQHVPAQVSGVSSGIDTDGMGSSIGTFAARSAGLTPHGHLMFAVFKSWLVVTQKQVCWNEQKHTYITVVVYAVVYHQPQTDG